MVKQYKGWELKSFDEAYNFRKFQISKIKKYIFRSNLLDVGAGNGGLVNYYFQIAKKINIFEPSKNLNKRIKKKFKNKKIKIYLNKPHPKKKFDVIMYMDVIEHIENYDQEIQSILKNLKNNGYLIINVPAFNCLYTEFDKNVGHTKRFVKKDLQDLAQKHLLKLKLIEYYDIIGFFLIFISKFIFQSHLKTKNVSRNIKIWNTLIPISKFLDKVFFNVLGKSLICVLQKK